jgi:hypothetical protein
MARSPRSVPVTLTLHTDEADLAPLVRLTADLNDVVDRAVAANDRALALAQETLARAEERAATYRRGIEMLLHDLDDTEGFRRSATLSIVEARLRSIVHYAEDPLDVRPGDAKVPGTDRRYSSVDEDGEIVQDLLRTINAEANPRPSTVLPVVSARHPGADVRGVYWRLISDGSIYRGLDGRLSTL